MNKRKQNPPAFAIMHDGDGKEIGRTLPSGDMRPIGLGAQMQRIQERARENARIREAQERERGNARRQRLAVALAAPVVFNPAALTEIVRQLRELPELVRNRKLHLPAAEAIALGLLSECFPHGAFPSPQWSTFRHHLQEHPHIGTAADWLRDRAEELNLSTAWEKSPGVYIVSGCPLIAQAIRKQIEEMATNEKIQPKQWHETVRAIKDHIDNNPGCTARQIASAVHTSEENARRHISEKLLPIGYFNPGGGAGYFPPT